MRARQQLALGLLDGGNGEKAEEILVKQGLPVGGAVFRGNVIDQSKAFLWRRVGIREFMRTRGKAHDIGKGIKLLMLGDESYREDPWLRERYGDWLESLPASARLRAIDFAVLEHFRSHGQGALFYMTNRNFYVTPGADRTVLRSFISLPPNLRDADLILERTVPELLDVPYAGKADNEIRLQRPSLDDALSAARVGGSRL